MAEATSTHRAIPAAAAFDPSECLDCGYSRLGIDGQAHCPECGALPPDPTWTLVRGWSSSESPWISIVVGGVLALLVGGCSVGSLLSAVTRGAGSSVGAMIGGGVVGGVAVLSVYRAIQRLRSRPRGGDVLWIVKGDEIEVRRGGSVQRISIRSLSDVRRSRSLLRTWSRFQTVPRFMTTGIGLVAVVWVRRREVDDVELLRKLRQAVGRP